ncbi:MAG: response regulator transcription factor [Sphingomonas sp.]|nr:response regulator transcription factor [Sphingomonas sp.]
MKLLIVEDDVPLRDLVAEHLETAGYTLDAVGRADEALAALRLSQYDLLLLDLNLPDGSGEHLLTEARMLTRSELPIVIFTARDALNDRLSLLNAGADDFILKPFDLLELEARLRAVLRRPGRRRENRMTCGDLSFDVISRTADVSGRELTLSRREGALLEELLRACERTVVREALEERLYAFREPVTPNALEALVSRLRRRLQAAGGLVAIETIRGIGYRLISS